MMQSDGLLPEQQQQQQQAQILAMRNRYAPPNEGEEDGLVGAIGQPAPAQPPMDQPPVDPNAAPEVVPVDTRTPNIIPRPAEQSPADLSRGVQPGQGQLAPSGKTDPQGRPMLDIQQQQAGLAPGSNEVSTADGMVPSFTPPGPQPAMPNLPAPPTRPPVEAPTSMQTMQQKAADLSGLGPRPSTNADLAPGQAHHGWRKALDVAAAVGMGAYTMNPLAGVGVYKMMNGAPLRRAQATYDAKQENAKQSFDAAKNVEQENVGESRIQSLTDRNKGLEEERDAKSDKMNAQFVAGTEKEDEKSPTGWTATTVGGETKPFQPKRSKSDDFNDTQGLYEKEADRLHLQGDDRKFYIANHKLREPNPNQSQVDEDKAARLQRQQEHDDEMREQHYQTNHARWAEHKSAIEKEQEAQYAKVEQEWQKKYGPQGADILGNREKSPDKIAAMAELTANKKLIEDAVQTRFKELGPEPETPEKHTAPKSAPESAPQGAPETAPVDGPEKIAVPAVNGLDGKGPLAAIPEPVASVRAPQQKPSPGTPAAQPQGKPSISPITKTPVQIGEQYTVGNKIVKVVSINPKNGKIQTIDVGPAPAQPAVAHETP
jgi:hypothetical protein